MRGARTSWVVICGGLLAACLGACNALDEPPARLEPGPHVIVPTDDRPAVQALRTPPAIIGGTLAVTPDGQRAIVADPERDRISIVDLTTRAVQEIALEEGAEPGRVMIDFNGLAQVVLRRAGDVLTLEPESGTMIARRHACAAPRGIVATTSRTDQIKVVCAGGELVTLRATSDGASVVQLAEDDLRDVLEVDGTSLLISRFKSAELIQVDVDGKVSAATALPTLTRSMDRTRRVGNGEDFSVDIVTELHTMQPHVAWRTAQSPADGSIWMLHQAESQNEIEVTDEPQADGSPYGGSGFSCSGIVQTAISHVSNGQVMESSSIAGVVLAVDMAVSPNGQALAIAQAGMRDSEAPQPTTVFIGDDGETAGASSGPAIGAPSPGGAVEIIRTTDVPADGCRFAEPLPVGGQATAVAFRPNGEIVVQLREPAKLVVLDDPLVAGPFGARAIAEIPLGGESMRDTGHDLFHMSSAAGIACAGCHAEGGDDGHVWNFSTVGARRTQAVNVGLAGTLPLHWDGDMTDLGMIMDKVFVGRMGGVRQSKERLEVLENWVFSLRPPPAMVAVEDEAALRGKELFESGEVGCAGCHNGDALTNNGSYDVGTRAGNPLQVPSLRGVGYRAPFIHSGCARTLRDRFDPSCGGGDQHGHTSQLSEEQVGDLVAYLKTL